MTDRTKAPDIARIKKLTIPEIDVYSLANGTRVCEANLGSQDIIKIEIVHEAGRSCEDFPLVSRAVSSLIKDGCAGKNSQTIAEEIDYYGSSIRTASNLDFSFTTFYCLTKYASQGIDLLHEMYSAPVFPADEIEKFKKLNIQKLREELTKNDVITYRQITEEIFGKDHPYGYNSTENDYLRLSRDRLVSHFQDYYGSDNCYIFLSGKVTAEIRNQIGRVFGSVSHPSRKKEYHPCRIEPASNKIRLYSRNEHQSSIKTGRRLFGKNHPDNVVFFLLNTILGGYFGSRLMSSIREDMGYTYDIHSSMDQMLHDGYFYVGTEAATEYVEPILKEIYHQMDLLKTKKVGSKELQMVKNYVMGNFMNMLDGPMNVGSFAKSMVMIGKQPRDFEQFVDEMTEITPLKIMEAAHRYLNEDQMTEVIVSPQGNM